MKNKITLVTMPLCGIDHPHLGVAYLASHLESNQYTVVQYDYNLELHLKLSPEEREDIFKYSRKWSSYDDYMNSVYPVIEPHLDEAAEKLASEDSGIIGFSIYYSNTYSTIKLAKKIKKLNPEKVIIVGGPETSKKYLKFDCIDFLVIGEGEESLLELLNEINGKQLYNKIKGIAFRKENEIIYTGERELIKDLDKLPFPKFQDSEKVNYNNQCIPIMGSRGCVNKCSFCTETKYWKSYRSRSAENIFKEFVHQIEKYGKYQSDGQLREVVFLDSLVNGNRKTLVEFCKLLIEHKSTVPWVGKAAISTNITPETLEIIKKSGCKKLMFGLESGSPSVIKAMKKRFDVETAERVLKATKESGIDVQLYMIFGFPTETKEHFYETVDFIYRNRQYIDEVCPGVGCQVEKDSDLFINKELYGVEWEPGQEKNSENWKTVQLSLEERLKRVKEFENFCLENNVNLIKASLEAHVPQIVKRKSNIVEINHNYNHSQQNSINDMEDPTRRISNV